MPSVLHLFLPVLLLPSVLAFCPYPTPPAYGITVSTRELVKLPGSARILSIKPFPDSRDLAVATKFHIYRVSPSGSYKLLLDVSDAFRKKSAGGALDPGSGGSAAHGGLRSVAFHPNFKKNGLLYISAMEKRPRNPKQFRYVSNVNNPVGADSVLVEYKMKNGVVNPYSYRLLFRVGMPVYDHPIKQIEFYGKYLYIAHGDGSKQSATVGGGQNGDALGKILKINPLKSGGNPYTVPMDRKFPGNGRPGMPKEVFAFGFRNPHTICFDKKGNLFVADAGRDNREEINIVKNGRNYGWAEREGTCRHLENGGIDRGVEPIPNSDPYEYPVAEYRHVGRTGEGYIGVAVAGGCPVENGSKMAGKYWFADFPKSGELYYTKLADMFKARTNGKKWELKQAKIYKARIDYKGRTFNSLGDLMRSLNEYRNRDRIDVRMGRGHGGVLYWSSKTMGTVFTFTSSETKNN